MELKLDKTTKILLGAIALGLFLNASNVFIDKAYASDVHRIAICDKNGYRCADISIGKLKIGN
jgi:hypothetical protein